jgi:opacity protein-like surface antigen
MGLDGGTVWDRQLRDNAELRVYQAGHLRGYGLTDWLSVYGKIGWAHLEVDDPTIIKRGETGTSNSFGENLLLSVQVKGRLWRHAASGWEWDGSARYVDMRAERKDDNEGRWSEWQFATSVAKRWGRFTPYGGAKFSTVNFKYKVREDGTTIRQDTYKEDGSLGPFLGVDLSLGQDRDVVVNLESAYVGGPEVTLAVSYTF